MKVCKVVTRMSEKIFKSKVTINNIVFKTDDDEFNFIHAMNESKNNGYIADYKMINVNMRVTPFDELIVGMSLDDVKKLLNMDKLSEVLTDIKSTGSQQIKVIEVLRSQLFTSDDGHMAPKFNERIDYAIGQGYKISSTSCSETHMSAIMIKE